jgi:hypothetical protein
MIGMSVGDVEDENICACVEQCPRAVQVMGLDADGRANP